MKKSPKPILIVIGLTILIGNVYSDSPPKKVRVVVVNECNNDVRIRLSEYPDTGGGPYSVLAHLDRNETIEFDDVEAGQDFYLAVLEVKTFQGKRYGTKKPYKREIRCDTLVVLRYDDERGYEWLDFELEYPYFLKEK